MKTIALAGNPNCGKTTVFNAFTGSNQYVGNWPGVTVEKKEGILKGHSDVTIVDLPGIYSLSPYTLDEIVARNYILQERPDLIVNIIDATNLERNLYLTTQLIETGIPVLIACNMMDLMKDNAIDMKTIAKELGCHIFPISAFKNEGIDDLIQMMVQETSLTSIKKYAFYSEEVTKALLKSETICTPYYNQTICKWYAIKHLENDEQLRKQSVLSKEDDARMQELRTTLENNMDDDMESIITNERYEFISTLMDKTYVRKRNEISISDKIDKVVTNRFLALPIFALVMFLVYFISVTSVGTLLTDWTNDVLFKEIIPPFIEGILLALNCAPWLMSLILDGIVAGIGAVIGFVPQMFVLFFFLAILEDCGYMARIAFIMDRVFRKFGLSGKSFIPMLIGSGCGVPGIMASRTIENEKDRRMTIMTTTFIPCSAKLPIIALIAGALFNGAPWVAPSAYFVGIAAIVCTGIILKKTRLFEGDPSPFIMELPTYHMPKMKNVLRSMWERGFSFIKKAGTIILLSSIFIWATSRFGIVDGTITMLEEDELSLSFLAVIGSLIAPIFAPLGWGNWQASVAAITGLVAKENVVATFGILYGFGEVAEDGVELWATLATSFTTAAAFSFLIFNLLCAPCFAAMGAIKREMNSAKWTIFAIGYQCIFAYLMAFMVYQFASVTTIGFTLWTYVAIAVLILFLYALCRQPKRRQIQRKKLFARA